MKTALKIIGVVVVVLIVAALALPFLINVNSFRPQIESRLTDALGRPVKVGNLSLSILSGGVGADELSIADDPKFSNAPFIKAKSLKVGLEMMPLIFSKQLNVTEIVISEPEIALLRNQAGVWNFSSLASSSEKNKPAEKSSSPSNLSVGKLELTNGKISFGSIPSKRKPIVYDKVDILVRNLSLTSAFPLTVSLALPGGGSLKLDGTLGPINSNDVSLSPLQAKLDIKKLDMSQSALVDPNSGISGLADFEGSVASDGHAVKADGTLKTTNLKLTPKGAPSARPIQVQFVVEHNLQTEAGRIVRGDVAMGKALAKLTGTYDTHGEATSIRTKLLGQNMPVDELEAVLPAVGVVLPPGSQLNGGTLSLDLDSVGPVDKLVTTGSVKLSNSELSGFNLGSKMSAISALSGKQTGNDTSIQNLSSDVRVAPEGTKLDKISLVIPALGTVNGAGTVSPGGALNFNMAANLTGGAVTGLTQIAGLGGKGTGSIPFMIQGTTSNPTFVPDVKGIVGGQLKGLLGGVKAGAPNQNNPIDALTGLFGKKKKN
ncbi:MAG: AsmA family protein [Acidobacteria bacterium]|nr:AsmA family protein [Acidobacteriota bacterium]